MIKWSDRVSGTDLQTGEELYIVAGNPNSRLHGREKNRLKNRLIDLKKPTIWNYILVDINQLALVFV